MICIYHIQSEQVFVAAQSIAAILPERNGNCTLYMDCVDGGVTIDETAHDAYSQWWSMLHEEPEIEIEFEMD